jgi:hypothetical protein
MSVIYLTRSPPSGVLVRDGTGLVRSVCIRTVSLGVSLALSACLCTCVQGVCTAHAVRCFGIRALSYLRAREKGRGRACTVNSAPPQRLGRWWGSPARPGPGSCCQPEGLCSTSHHSASWATSRAHNTLPYQARKTQCHIRDSTSNSAKTERLVKSQNHAFTTTAIATTTAARAANHFRFIIYAAWTTRPP